MPDAKGEALVRNVSIYAVGPKNKSISKNHTQQKKTVRSRYPQYKGPTRTPGNQHGGEYKTRIAGA